MANAVGALPVGEVRQWQIKRALPVGNERGSIQAVRDIKTPLAHCREVLFTVEQEGAAPAYASTICQRQDGQWKWAAAEPSVARWNGLQ
jgi:surface antigen